ncbi:helix-turn-helix domain-containing protein [Enterococcus sp. AZ194]|uniref:helix-turn-helix domain-containing protein n=1 Tax=Enterococcus sp. AZ194 TaxID=2774629 RepID=UPI003F6854EA
MDGKLAAKWLKETYNIDYKESSILQQMHQIGLSHTRPSYVLANADKEKQAEFLEQLEAEKKTRKWGD